MFWAWTDNLIIVLLLVQLGFLYCDELLRSRIYISVYASLSSRTFILVILIKDCGVHAMIMIPGSLCLSKLVLGNAKAAYLH